MFHTLLSMTNQGLVEVMAHAKWLAGRVAGIWLTSWAIRRRLGVNTKLTTQEHVTRWCVVLLCLVIMLLQGPQFLIARIAAGLIGLWFLVWPNVSHHVVRFIFRRGENATSR